MLAALPTAAASSSGAGDFGALEEPAAAAASGALSRFSASVAAIGAEDMLLRGQEFPKAVRDLLVGGHDLHQVANDGYCGEVSAVMALLKFGGYVSQYDVRAIATRGGNQSIDYYLVGENDEAAAAKLRLAHIRYPNTCAATRPRRCSVEYLAWVKTMVRRGHAVTITVYMNSFLFFNTTAPRAGEPQGETDRACRGLT